ncbi:hypothetical protein CC79DRAFT_1369245 [Sarocladium strictum]
MADGRWLYTGDLDDPYKTDLHSYFGDQDEADQDDGEDGLDGSGEEDEINENDREYDFDERGEEDVIIMSTTYPGIRHVWRTTPDTTIFNPLVESMIQTVTRGMPALQEFCFDVQPPSAGELIIAFQMADAGLEFIRSLDRDAPPEKQEDESSLRRFKTWVGPEWKVPDGIL